MDCRIEHGNDGLWALTKKANDDRVSDSASTGRPGRDCGVGGIFLSAEIVQFTRGAKHEPDQSKFPTIAFRSAARPDKLAMNHVDTAPCEYVRPEPTEAGDG
jgi:hypothetical protein